MKVSASLLLLLVACGTGTSGRMGEPVVNRTSPPAPADNLEHGITDDARILEGLQVWKEDCARYSSYNCKKLLDEVWSIKVGPLSAGVLGTCQLWGVGPIITRREVTIIPSIAANPVALRAVLAHELGHCALLINHVTNDAAHLMAPYLEFDRTLETRLPAMLQKFYADAQANILPRVQ